MNSFEGQFRYILKYKNSTSLVEAKEFNIDIEENLLDSKNRTVFVPSQQDKIKDDGFQQ
jgi:hypothetical protein